MQTIYHVNCDNDLGEFFFNDKFEMLSYWDSNDASWRGEYMNPLLEQLGFKVKKLSPKDKRVWDIVKNTLIKCGVDEESLNYV